MDDARLANMRSVDRSQFRAPTATVCPRPSPSLSLLLTQTDLVTRLVALSDDRVELAALGKCMASLANDGVALSALAATARLKGVEFDD